MAKSRKRQTPKLAQEAYRDDRPGSERTADGSPPVPKAKRRRRTWEFQMILDEPLPMFRDHPLSGLTPEERDAARVKALGQVLATIALRKTGRCSDHDEPEPLENDADDLVR